MSLQAFYTRSGVRLRLRAEREGSFNWLFLPGGPGIGSESLHELADALDVPGRLWMVDLPGDGSNVAAPGMPADPFSVWPGAVVEAAQALPYPIFVGHSTGGMYLLDSPELEPLLAGMVLVSTAPDARWHSRFVAMTQRHSLPGVDATSARYEAEPTPDRLRDIAVASADWNFTPEFVEAGRELLGRMPYCPEAVDWSDRHFDHVYAAQWWPISMPTLILSGAEDRIVDQSLWGEERFGGPNVLHRTIEGGAHFPWIERPEAVRSAFAEFAGRIASHA